jgi:hypothetical protein
MDVIITGITAISWIGVAALTFFLWRIARFYERSSERSAYSWLFLLPLVLLPAGALYYILHDSEFYGVPAGDVLLLAGGVSLLVASLTLQQVLVEER